MSPRPDSYCLLKCGCLDTMLGHLHTLGTKYDEVACFWHGWQIVVKVLTDTQAGSIHYERTIRHKQDTLF
jgi:hypothetical protein